MDITNKYSCFILRSSEKKRDNSSKRKASKSGQRIKDDFEAKSMNRALNISNVIMPSVMNLNQRLEEIEADAQALKRSMLDNSISTNTQNNMIESEFRGTNVSST